MKRWRRGASGAAAVIGVRTGTLQRDTETQRQQRMPTGVLTATMAPLRLTATSASVGRV